MIAKVRKPKKFKLTGEDIEENNRILMALESLKQNIGWMFLTQVLEENIRVMEENILNKYDENGAIISEDELDKLRNKRSFYKELLEKPDFYMKKLKTPNVVENSLDPYYQGKN